MVGQSRIPQICIFTPMVIAFVFLTEMGFDGRNVSALLSSNLVSIKLNSVSLDLRKLHSPFPSYLSELRRDFLASVGITYAVFRIAKSRERLWRDLLKT